MVFVADDLGAWLIGALADAGRKKLTSLVLGSEQERALRSAATLAVQLTAAELRPGDDDQAQQLAMVVSEVFGTTVPGAPLAGHATVLEALQAGIAGQLAVLDDASLTGTGQSSADVLGVPGAVVAAKLTGHLVREIVVRGSRGGPLAPLASQLNHDRTYLQDLRTEDKVDRLDDKLMELLALLGGTRAVATAPQQQWASVLPDRPAVLVERPDLLATLRHALLAADGQPVLAAGMGGAGKSVLAAQLARAVRDGDAELAAAYPAGVVWVTVGRERPVAAVQLELARAFGEDQPDLGGDWRSGRARLQQLAAGRRGLVVLDDVWTQGRYEPFRLDAPGVQLLITTRNQTLADDLGGVQVPVGELGKEQSRELLASQAGLPPQQLPAEAGELLSLVGNLALGLAMVGAIVRDRGPQAWPGLLRRLRERQLGKFAHKFADNYEHATLLRAIEVAVDDLDPADQRRWAELAVFAGQGRVPESAIATLWQPFDQDDLDTGDRISRFLARSLLQAVGQGRYRLHDLQYDVAFLRLGTDPEMAQHGLAEVHARLADAYIGRVADVAGTPSQAGWAELAAALARKPAADPAWRVADDGYLLDHIVDHLCRGSRSEDAAALLTGYDWITIGLGRRGLAQVAADYGLPAMDSMRMVRDALNRSARALSSDPDCLPDQLLGRLAGVRDAALAPLLARLRAEQAHRPLQIIRSGLQQASGSLVHILVGHRDPIWAVAVTGDGNLAVSGGDDGAAIVWDLTTGTGAAHPDRPPASAGRCGGSHGRRRPGSHRRLRRGRDRVGSGYRDGAAHPDRPPARGRCGGSHQ